MRLDPATRRTDACRPARRLGCAGPITLAAEARRHRGIGRLVKTIVDKGDPAYGINTGFGILAKARIPTKSWNNCSAT
jgi:histidine ammonia-lyase